MRFCTLQERYSRCPGVLYYRNGGQRAWKRWHSPDCNYDHPLLLPSQVNHMPWTLYCTCAAYRPRTATVLLTKFTGTFDNENSKH